MPPDSLAFAIVRLPEAPFKLVTPVAPTAAISISLPAVVTVIPLPALMVSAPFSVFTLVTPPAPPPPLPSVKQLAQLILPFASSCSGPLALTATVPVAFGIVIVFVSLPDCEAKRSCVVPFAPVPLIVEFADCKIKLAKVGVALVPIP